MYRRDLLRRGVYAGAALLGAPMFNSGRCRLFGGTREYPTRAVDLVNSSVVVDMLGLLTLDWERLERWQADPATLSAADAQTLRDSGVTVFHPAVELNGSDPYSASKQWFERWNGLLSARGDVLSRVLSAEHMVSAKREGKIGVLLGMQNSDHFRSAGDVDTFHALGQRISQLTYNGQNLIGCGCTRTRDTGLTAFGASVVERMNAVGMAVDVSHAGDRTTLDAMAVSSKPVLITHSNCRALVPHPRCKSDQIIRATAQRGSVMGLTAIRAFVSRRGVATLDDLLDHYDHVARLVGVEHLGVGSDSDPLGRDAVVNKSAHPVEVTGIDHPRRVYDLAAGLMRRGYSDGAIRLILGQNVLRVLKEIFDVPTADSVPSNI